MFVMISIIDNVNDYNAVLDYYYKHLKFLIFGR